MIGQRRRDQPLPVALVGVRHPLVWLQQFVRDFEFEQRPVSRFLTDIGPIREPNARVQRIRQVVAGPVLKALGEDGRCSACFGGRGS